MALRSPVRGLRPSRGGRVLVEKVPNPAMVTVSPFASVSVMVVNTALTAASEAALVSEVRLATRDASSDFFFCLLLRIRRGGGCESGRARGIHRLCRLTK